MRANADISHVRLVVEVYNGVATTRLSQTETPSVAVADSYEVACLCEAAAIAAMQYIVALMRAIDVPDESMRQTMTDRVGMMIDKIMSTEGLTTKVRFAE